MTKLDQTVLNNWLVERSPFEIMWMNESGQIISANNEFCKRVGYSKTEITNLKVFDLNISATDDSWKAHIEKVKKEGKDNFKATHKTKEGTFYEVEVFAQYFSDNGNNLICAVMNDISQSSFYYRLMTSVQKLNSVGGWMLDIQDGSILVTEEAYAIFKNTTSKDFMPNTIVQKFKDQELFRKLILDAMQKGKGFNEVFETTQVPRKYIRCIVNPIKKGQKVYKLLGSYQDITKQRLKQKKLQFFKEIIDNTQDLIYTYNREGKLLHYNQRVSEVLGFTNEELDDFSIFDLDSNITEDWWQQHFDTIKKAKVSNLEWLIRRKDGTKFPAEITANHLVYDGVDINCAIIRDVTVRKAKDLKLYEALEEIKSLKERLEDENEYLQDEIEEKLNFGSIICRSDEYGQVLKKVNQVAPTDTTVLITGESGTGKELIARAVHTNSLRSARPMISVNCATLPKELFESELFGHKKGSFTGAYKDKVGKFDLADGGTIFLDEIGEVPLELQPKLLRVIQEGQFDILGSSKTSQVDVRIIAATNRELKQMVKEGLFREDLYYRLNVFPIDNIPLRARKDDILPLANYFLNKYSSKAGKSFKKLSKQTERKLLAYDYPGNIRELENLIERAVIIENGTTLNPGSWIPEVETESSSQNFKTIDQHQRDYIIEVLNHTNWRVGGPRGAASILNIHDKTLFARMKKLGIEKQISAK